MLVEAPSFPAGESSDENLFSPAEAYIIDQFELLSAFLYFIINYTRIICFIFNMAFCSD
jgi:hypothetical protein